MLMVNPKRVLIDVFQHPSHDATRLGLGKRAQPL